MKAHVFFQFLIYSSVWGGGGGGVQYLLDLQEWLHKQFRCYINPSDAKATFVQNMRTQRSWKPSKPCHVGIYGIAFAEYSQMSTHVPGFQ